VTLGQKTTDQMTADEAAAAGDEIEGHEKDLSKRVVRSLLRKPSAVKKSL